MSNFTPLLWFGVNVELSSLLSVSFNIDLMCGPWSTGPVFSQEMLRLSNLDRARAIDMVQSGTSCHDVSLTFDVNKSTITRLMTRYRETGNVKRSCQEWSYQKDNTANWQHTLGLLSPSCSRWAPNAVYQHHNVRPHTARIFTDHFQQNNVDVLEWPACFMDLSPIEHLWDQLGRAVCARLAPNHNLGHLRQFVREEWARIPPAEFHNTHWKHEEQISWCIGSRGGPTHYWTCIPINDKSWDFKIVIFTYLPHPYI